MTWISMGRRLAVLTVALAFGLALSACGKKEEEKAAPAPAAEQKAPEQAAPAAQPAPAAPQEAAPAPAPAAPQEAAPAPAPAPESAPPPSGNKSDTMEKMKDMGDKAGTEMKQQMKDVGDKAGEMKSDKPADDSGDKSDEGPPRDE
ncbi:MAG: hypothetical protein WAN51_13425 [Alphaproteobacteria bacterium]